MPVLQLTPPDDRLQDAFLPLAHEFQAAGEAQWLRNDGFGTGTFADYVARLSADRAREVYWVRRQGDHEVVAVTSVRTGLPPQVATWHGHIDFRVKPSRRRRGVGTQTLGLALGRAAARGIDDALLVCLGDNLPARRIIQRHGGTWLDEHWLAGLEVMRYRVPARSAPGAR